MVRERGTSIQHSQEVLPIRHHKSTYIAWWGVVLCLFGGNEATATEPLERYEFLQIRMGIPVTIVLYAERQATANHAAKAAYDRIKELDRILSDFDPDSELSRLCTDAEPGIPQGVSPELMQVLTAAQELSHRTGGAFDVTVGPIVRLWRIARRRESLPDDDRLHAALESVGYRNVVLHEAQHHVELALSGMQLDLGGIAKGYAADEALRVLQAHGVTRALIDAGGDVVAGDPPPERDGWRVEIEDFRSEAPSNSLPRILNLANAAVATSGDAYQFLEVDGVRYSHIVDPRTGLGLTTPSSVTVIAPTGMAADSWASAVSVLGPSLGLRLIEETPDTESYIVQLQGVEQRRECSSGFRSLLAP